MSRNWLHTMTALSMLAASAASPVMAMGTIRARSDVASQVFVDGAPVGQAPVDVTQLKAGPHEVRIVASATGEARSYQINVPRSASVDKVFQASFGPGIGAVEPAGSTLEIASSMPADVTLDGQPLGRAPLIARNVPPGLHVVRVTDPATGIVQTRPVRISEDPSALARMEFVLAAPAPIVVQQVVQPVRLRPYPVRTVYYPVVVNRRALLPGIPVVVTGGQILLPSRGRGHGRHHGRGGSRPGYW